MMNSKRTCIPINDFFFHDSMLFKESLIASITDLVFNLSYQTDRPEQTVQTFIRRRILRRLIRVCTVCHLSSSFETDEQIFKWTFS